MREGATLEEPKRKFAIKLKFVHAFSPRGQTQQGSPSVRELDSSATIYEIVTLGYLKRFLDSKTLSIAFVCENFGLLKLEAAPAHGDMFGKRGRANVRCGNVLSMLVEPPL